MKMSLRATLLTAACALMIAALACQQQAFAAAKKNIPGNKCDPWCSTWPCSGSGNCAVVGDVGKLCTEAGGATAFGRTGTLKDSCHGTIPTDTCTSGGDSLCQTQYDCYCTRIGAGVGCLVSGAATGTTNTPDCP